MKKLYKFLYNIFAKRLPKSNAKYNFGSKQIRYFLAKHLIDSIGSNVNIEKGATFPYSVKIGNNSGIGVRCEIYGEI